MADARTYMYFYLKKTFPRLELSSTWITIVAGSRIDIHMKRIMDKARIHLYINIYSLKARPYLYMNN